MTTIKDLVAEGRSLLEKCSEGPWKTNYNGTVFSPDTFEEDMDRGDCKAEFFEDRNYSKQDAIFTVWSRNHLSQLLDAVERLLEEKENEK